MTFEFRPAQRENVPLLIGLAGGTGSGKTFSALRLAKGMGGGKRFVVIDTENGRALHYADQFEFDHGMLGAPFRPERYADAIEAADAAGYPVIVVDSVSHEHAGDGGLLDWHDEEYQRLGGRDAVKMSAWIKPKTEHKRMVSRLLQVRAHVILCFRAEEKVEIVKEGGKTVIRPKQSLTGLDGWLPISEKNLPYELTLSFLLVADRPGVPRPIKLQEQHRSFVSLDEPVDEAMGVRLAEWAAGGAAAPVPIPLVVESAPELTAAQETKLNLLVGTLREAGAITTEQVVTAVATMREEVADDLIASLSLRDDEGTLRWSLLRPHLTKAEGSSLIERLDKLEKNVGAAA